MERYYVTMNWNVKIPSFMKTVMKAAWLMAWLLQSYFNSLFTKHFHPSIKIREKYGTLINKFILKLNNSLIEPNEIIYHAMHT